jgi:hypothetical protein
MVPYVEYENGQRLSQIGLLSLECQSRAALQHHVPTSYIHHEPVACIELHVEDSFRHLTSSTSVVQHIRHRQQSFGHSYWGRLSLWLNYRGERSVLANPKLVTHSRQCLAAVPCASPRCAGLKIKGQNLQSCWQLSWLAAAAAYERGLRVLACSGTAYLDFGAVGYLLQAGRICSLK